MEKRGQGGGPEEASEKREEWVPGVFSMSVGPQEGGKETRGRPERSEN